MTPDNDLINEFRRLPERTQENIARKAQILIELSHDESNESAEFVNAKMKSWKFSPAYLFGPFENIISRQDMRFCERLIEYFNREKEFEKTVWPRRDDPQGDEHARDCQERFGHLKYDFKRSEMFKKWPVLLAEKAALQERRKQWEKTLIETISFPRGTKQASILQKDKWDKADDLDISNFRIEDWKKWGKPLCLMPMQEGLFNKYVYHVLVGDAFHEYKKCSEGIQYKFKKESDANQFLERLQILLSNFIPFDDTI